MLISVKAIDSTQKPNFRHAQHLSNHTRKDMKFRHLPNLSRLVYRETWLNSNAHASHVLSVVFPDHS